MPEFSGVDIIKNLVENDIARVRSDGHIYTTIRYGRRRMPGYARIAREDRWDIVNYVRYLNGQGGVGQ